MTDPQSRKKKDRAHFMILIATRNLASILAVTLLLSACGSTGAGTKLASTGVFGKNAAGKNTSATYIAALQGGVVERAGGASLGRADRQRALEAEYRALEAAPGGQPVTWGSGDVKGSVVAAAPYQVGSQNCRQYSHTVTVEGKIATARGAACRNPNGTWTPLT